MLAGDGLTRGSLAGADRSRRSAGQELESLDLGSPRKKIKRRTSTKAHASGTFAHTLNLDVDPSDVVCTVGGGGSATYSGGGGSRQIGRRGSVMLTLEEVVD